MPKISPTKLKEFFDREFPQMQYILEEFDEEFIGIRKKVSELDLRPGGTVSGPTLMALADFAIYVAILREIGLVGLAVTTSFNINFLRKPEAENDIVGKCKLLKCGKPLTNWRSIHLLCRTK